MLHSPLPNPLIVMLASPHMCAQTTAATQKQFCSNEGFSDKKMFAAYDQPDMRSPNAVRNFAYPIQKHFQSNQDELMNSFDKSPDMAPEFLPITAEGH